MRRARYAAVALAFLALVGTAGRAQDHSGHAGHAGHAMPAAGPDQAPAPDAPMDHAADGYFDREEMAGARAMLRHESGGMANRKLMIDQLEWVPARGANGYAWEVEGWTGGDIDRLAVKSRGEGSFGGGAGKIEVQAGWRHALDPWFNLHVGVRQDFQPRPRRTHAVVAIEGLAPYWFEIEGELFLSNKGEVTARAEASYDQRITQSLILQPSMEVNLSAKDMPALGTGPGLTSVELGLRLRYELAREFAPYLGLNWERKLGRTAAYARGEGEQAGALRFVTGVRMWF